MFLVMLGLVFGVSGIFRGCLGFRWWWLGWFCGDLGSFGGIRVGFGAGFALFGGFFLVVVGLVLWFFGGVWGFSGIFLVVVWLVL